MTTRTLADMTPAERDACVGMWCERRDADLAIISAVEDMAVVVFPRAGGWRWDNLSNLTPRMDLPRAWTPGGKPVPGEWDDDNGRNAMRRFQSEWEWKHDTPQHIIDQHDKDTP